MSLVVQALRDYWDEALEIFQKETDQPQDIAEDVVRDAIDRMGVSGTQDRLYGKVDIKKAIYVFLPEPTLVALMLDAKAEKRNGDQTATIQMSQTSMRVRMKRKGEDIEECGGLPTEIRREGRIYRVVTIIVKFVYKEIQDKRHQLDRIVVACIPSRDLQDDYNPDSNQVIWLAGKDSPKRGENFRVRLAFDKLKEKAGWRVCTIDRAEPAGADRN